MKILLIFTFYLSSGLVDCFDVIGYPKGSVIVYCENPTDEGNSGYFCKKSGNQCVYLKSNMSQNSWDHKGRVSLQESFGVLTVTFRDLSVEDAGLYQCGETGGWSHTVNLRVKTDPCCSGSKTVIGYLGETVTIGCSSPEGFKSSFQYVFKLIGPRFTVAASSAGFQKDRFSISEDRRSKGTSLRIRDVREEDGGVYFCAVVNKQTPVRYYSLYTQIQLQITDSTHRITLPTEEPPSTNTSTSKNSVITQNSLFLYSIFIISNDGRTNDPPGMQESVSITSVYYNIRLNNSQSDSIYQSLDPITTQPYSIYQSLNPNTNQSDSVYENLNTITNQTRV
ncbi:hypothetical protein AMEX_G24734 [Astyanax mexicanus]|uniref:Ig-like domain-containing protein n=1 Tax=Astyanax mexicanus TaxID=7994 RepID=A0A8T2KVY4_ASTMX|nr:hypothetical protein AMEX_G24734 [Astyanax mexicanus]